MTKMDMVNIIKERVIEAETWMQTCKESFGEDHIACKKATSKWSALPALRGYRPGGFSFGGGRMVRRLQKPL